MRKSLRETSLHPGRLGRRQRKATALLLIPFGDWPATREWTSFWKQKVVPSASVGVGEPSPLTFVASSFIATGDVGSPGVSGSGIRTRITSCTGPTVARPTSTIWCFFAEVTTG